MTYYIIRCKLTREDIDMIVCPDCATSMPPVDGSHVRAEKADDDCDCEFCDKKGATK